MNAIQIILNYIKIHKIPNNHNNKNKINQIIFKK